MSLRTFFRIGEANDEIKRLNTELAAARHAQQTAEQARDAAVAEVTPLKAQIATLEGNIATLTTERDTARTELATAQASIVEKDTEIATLKGEKTTVETRAAEIAAGVGSKDALNEDPGASAGLSKAEQFRGIADSQKRAAFWAEHRDAILAGK